METKKWYVNQKVWDKTVSDKVGEVIKIDYNKKFPIQARFCMAIRSYTLLGIMVDNIFPTLSTKPYEIKMEGFSQEIEEEKLPYKSQVVWGKNVGDEKWYIGHFVKKEFKNYILNTTVDDENTGGNFTIITTKNPYEVEEDREPKIGDMVFAWDNEDIKIVSCGILSRIVECPNRRYYLGNILFFNCSLKNPLIK